MQYERPLVEDTSLMEEEPLYVALMGPHIHTILACKVHCLFNFGFLLVSLKYTVGKNTT
jgi:hypothetical protein